MVAKLVNTEVTSGSKKKTQDDDRCQTEGFKMAAHKPMGHDVTVHQLLISL